MDLYCQEHTQPGADAGLDPVIILHGMFGAGDNWLNIARAIGVSRPVWTIDLPGHGKSHDPQFPGNIDGMFDYRSLALALETCLSNFWRPGRGNQKNRYIVCGHSMGAKVAMALALMQPALVKALICVDSAPLNYGNRGYNADVLHMLKDLDPHQMVSRLEADKSMAHWIADPLVRGFLMKNLQTMEGGGLRWRFNVEAILKGAKDIADWPLETGQYPPFPGPALFLAGELSDYIDPVADAPIIRRFFPGAAIEIVPGARHWVHVDNKAGFLMQISSFLSKLDAMGEI